VFFRYNRVSVSIITVTFILSKAGQGGKCWDGFDGELLVRVNANAWLRKEMASKRFKRRVISLASCTKYGAATEVWRYRPREVAQLPLFQRDVTKPRTWGEDRTVLGLL